MKRFNIITLFPTCFPGNLGVSLINKAVSKLYNLNIIDLKKYAHNYRVDDRPFGGEEGMLIQADILENTLLSNSLHSANNHIVYLSPRGKIFNQQMAYDLSHKEEITFICGRYEGIDNRFLEKYNVQEISIGDFILCGGEVAAMVVLETIIRLLPTCIKNAKSLEHESFSSILLEHDQYTRPLEWSNMKVPSILLSGDHKKIQSWKFLNSFEITENRRPDLIFKFKFYFILFLLIFSNSFNKKLFNKII
jgi:tRNA (guanine37-N1)-methyltransferase